MAYKSQHSGPAIDKAVADIQSVDLQKLNHCLGIFSDLGTRPVRGKQAGDYCYVGVSTDCDEHHWNGHAWTIAQTHLNLVGEVNNIVQELGDNPRVAISQMAISQIIRDIVSVDNNQTSNIADNAKAIAALQKVAEALSTLTAEHSNTISEHSNTLTNHQTELNNHSQVLEDHQKELANHAESISSLNDDIERIDNTDKEQQEQIGSNTTRITAVENRSSALEQQTTELNARTSELESKSLRYKGVFADASLLPTDAMAGDYAYVGTDTTALAVYTFGASWAATGEIVDLATVSNLDNIMPEDPSEHRAPTTALLASALATQKAEQDAKLTELEQEVIYDVSANNNGATFASLSALLSNVNLSTLIPTAVRCGGMSIRFVQSSDNKYIHFRYMSSSTAVADFTNVANWQGVDDEPTVGSKNLVTSGGVSTKINQITGGNFPYNLDLSEEGRYDTDGSEIAFEFYRRTGLIDISDYKSITVRVSYINASQYYAACILYKNGSLVTHYSEKEIYDNGGVITVQSSEYDAIKLCFPYNVVDTVSATVNAGGIIDGIEKKIDAIENNIGSLEDTIDTIDAIDPAVLIANIPLELTYSNGYYSDDGTVVEVAWAKRTDLISLENVLSITFDGTFTNFPAGFTIFYKDGVNVYRVSEGALYSATKPYTIDCQNYDAVKISFNATDIDKKKVYVKRESKLSVLEERVDALTPKYSFCPKVIGDFPFPINTDFVIYRDNVVTNNQDQEIVDYNSNDMDENKFMLRQGSVGDKLYEHDIYNADFTSYIKNVFRISYKQSNPQDIKVMLIGDSTIDTVVNGVVQTEGRIVHYLKSEYSGNLTLIGTRGEDPYKHCGIGGWSADNWANSQSYGGTNNPFYNPSTEKFDFAYGITNNSLERPDYVIIQLGINDVTATTSPTQFNTRMEAYIDAMQQIVNSIKAYSSSIKVCVNMIIPPSKDWNHYTAYAGAILTPNIAKWHDIIASHNALTRLANVDYFLPINCVVDRDTMLADRVHPNAIGYETIAVFLANCLSVM